MVMYGVVWCMCTGGDINEAGYVSGFIASSFMVGRLLSSFYWGRVADRIGRKPVFYIASVSIAAMSLMFGFSVNIYMAVVARLLLGLMNPVSGLIKTVVSELCIEKHQAFAMSVVSASWSIGLVIGPAVGGYTSRPAEQYPGSYLASFHIFHSFPYLLPNIITAVLSMTSMVLIYFILPETLRLSGTDNTAYEMVSVVADNENDDEDSDDHPEEGGDVEKCESGSGTEVPKNQDNAKNGFVMSFLHLLQENGVRVSVVAYFVISYISIAYDELLPLWALSEKQKGK